MATYATYPHFNSIKVRLKHIYARRTEEYYLFQFHKGTIKTRIFRITEHRQYQFQFHKGTIKTFTDDFICGSDCDFNSIKVRLKPNGNALTTENPKFQFHKGTIKTKSTKFRF